MKMKSASGSASEILKRRQLLDLSSGTVVRIPIEFIEPFELNPRKFFDDSDIALQSEYIKEKGDVVHPLEVVIRERKGQPFAMIVDGERRFRSAKLAAVLALSCLIKEDRSDKELFRDSFVANLNRRDMSPIEEALAIRAMMENDGLNQVQVSRIVGKHQTQVSATLKFLTLHTEVQAILLRGKVDKGIAWYLTSFPQEKQLVLLRDIEKEVERRGRKLSVNEAWSVILRIAEARGVRPVRGKRGRKHCTVQELVCRKVIRTGEQFQSAMAELAKVGNREILSQQKKYVFTIVSLFKDVEAMMKRQGDRLDKLD